MLQILLQAAISLLIAAQQPNVPLDLKIQAIQTATYVIEYVSATDPTIEIPQTPSEPIPTGGVEQTAETVVAISTKLNITPNLQQEVVGANCQNVSFDVVVFDQFDNAMSGKEISINAPSFFESKITGQNARFTYTPQSTSTIETIVFTSGNLQATTTVATNEGPKKSDLLFNGSYWYEKTGGSRVSTSTLKCI